MLPPCSCHQVLHVEPRAVHLRCSRDRVGPRHRQSLSDSILCEHRTYAPNVDDSSPVVRPPACLTLPSPLERPLGMLLAPDRLFGPTWFPLKWPLGLFGWTRLGLETGEGEGTKIVKLLENINSIL